MCCVCYFHSCWLDFLFLFIFCLVFIGVFLGDGGGGCLFGFCFSSQHSKECQGCLRFISGDCFLIHSAALFWCFVIASLFFFLQFPNHIRIPEKPSLNIPAGAWTILLMVSWMAFSNRVVGLVPCLCAFQGDTSKHDNTNMSFSTLSQHFKSYPEDVMLPNNLSQHSTR